MLQGLVCALAAYAVAGVFPLYWRLLDAAPLLQVAAHCVVWAATTFTVLLVATGQWRDFWTLGLTRKNVLVYALAGALLTFNHVVMIYGTASRNVLELSAGLFLAPFMDAVLARIVLGEPISWRQYASIACSLLGVGLVGVGSTLVPIIALVLPVTTGMYNILKPMAPLEMLHGYALEALLALPLAAAYLIIESARGASVFVGGGSSDSCLLVGAGLLSVVPLLLLTRAAMLLPTVSFSALQYIAPIIQLCLASFYFQEPLTWLALVGCGVIVLAAVAFTCESIREASKANDLLPALYTIYLYGSPVQSSLGYLDRPSLEV
ncbi:hypothetical protein SPRG_06521 [Saprolegnia parasitica CBS 223.65]|uniref:EamA domain-containing protein n=1 Tax=Saprolegnia parasitica (strain CBS 223.65) TaxID=695850 RepID=A0A067CPG2_SAPPC|nr:hypothetical protein SPRG_06521 [Saprolegnia parasitica CBS 223.65]KDO28667.1 hypothetical protein SPRG_06521 [Saprolegnia parasitica CBS 223.65]|eukprot:XP_012200726.1 hypothetical protein SPRG_06521 [Saprolegnia parasitica CBS 223.65]